MPGAIVEEGDRFVDKNPDDGVSGSDRGVSGSDGDLTGSDGGLFEHIRT